MRQWPGNGADLDFRGVIRGCAALLVSAPVVEGKISKEVMRNRYERAAFLESEEGVAAKKVLSGFRLWCVVELHAALEAGIPVVIRAGKAAREGDAVKFNTEFAWLMLGNLANMIDVERAECAVRADYDREMDAVRNGEGVETVNERVAGGWLEWLTRVRLDESAFNVDDEAARVDGGAETCARTRIALLLTREERFTGGKTIPGRAPRRVFARTPPGPPRRLWMPRVQQAWALTSSLSLIHI